MRVSVPRLFLGVVNVEIWSFSRSPTWRTFREPTRSSRTAPGDMSPPYSLTNCWKENLAPAKGNDFGSPFRVRNRWSVSQPCTTRSEGIRVAGSGSKHAPVRVSIRRISFLGKPVMAATFEWLTLPFFSREFAAAARTKAPRASIEKLFGVMPWGSRANASSPSKCSRSGCELSIRPGLPFRRT